MRVGDSVFVNGYRGVVYSVLDNRMVEVRLSSGIVCVDESDCVESTHDGQMIYPAGSALPEGAHGFTMCQNNGGAYASWLDSGDCARAREDRARIERDVAKLRSHHAVVSRAAELRIDFCGGRIADIRRSIMNAEYARLWPLIAV